MPHTIACSVCSRQKNEDPDPLPARERYTGSHVRYVESVAKAPLYILSGKYGLLEANDPVEYYDYRLTDGDVSALVRVIGTQLEREGIQEVIFYSKSKTEWLPYRKALQIACGSKGVGLTLQRIPDNA